MRYSGIVQRAVLVLAGLGLAVLCIEVALRAVGFMPRYSLAWGRELKAQPIVSVQLDPVVLYRVRPHGGEEINRYGYRDREFNLPRDGGPRPTLILGDSFAFGGNVPIEHTISREMERISPQLAPVWNLGVAGYGPDQELLRFMEEGADFLPRNVVVLIYLGNDFRDLSVNNLFELSESGGLRLSTENIVNRHLPLLRCSMLLRRAVSGTFLPRNIEHELMRELTLDGDGGASDSEHARLIALFANIIGSFETHTQRIGAKLFVALIPSWKIFSSEGSDLQSHRRAAEIAHAGCRRAGVACRDLTPELAARGGMVLYDAPADAHFNLQGAQVVAAVIAEEIPDKPS